MDFRAPAAERRSRSRLSGLRAQTPVDYQLHILDGGGRVANLIRLDCDDDYHALVVVSLRLAGRAAQLWQSDRMVGAYAAAHPHPPALSSPSARRARGRPARDSRP